MGYSFTAFQIAEVAAEVEETGAEFYRHIAEINIHEMAKEACGLLAEEELKHRDIFREIGREQEAEGGAAEFSIDVIGKMRALLAFIRERIFTLSTPDALTANTREILQTAIRIEEQLIQVFEELYFVFQGTTRETLKKILFEENRHLMTLLNVQEVLRLR